TRSAARQLPSGAGAAVPAALRHRRGGARHGRQRRPCPGAAVQSAAARGRARAKLGLVAMDNPERFEPYERTHEYVEALLHGRRPEPWPDLSDEDAEVLRMAGVFNAIGAEPRPRGEFVADLGAELEQ